MTHISVIVPVYIVEQFLPQCIESILCQSFSDFELILVDDGSPDNCGAICDEYAAKDSRVRVIHKENGGVSAARNSALEIASGKYITFCDSDDYYQPDWLENLYSAAQAHCSDLVVGQFLHVSETGEIIDQSQQEPSAHSIQQPGDKVAYMLQYILGRKHGWEIWSRLFRTDIINSNHVRFCENCGNFAEDLGFILEYLLYANHVFCGSFSGYCYRMRAGSMMDSSKGIARLDSVNEVGLQFIDTAKHVLPTDLHSQLPIIYFLIMNNQYSRIIGTDRYPKLKQELQKIRRYHEWKENTKAIFRSKRQLRSYFGRTKASSFLIFCRYCLHGNWYLHSLESVIFKRIHHIQ